jgi:uncharacterized protein (TIGR03382 family)
LQGESVTEVAENQTMTLALTGSDVDGQPLTYSYSSTPSLPGAPLFDAATGVLTWTPGFEVSTPTTAAVFTIEVTVSDGFYTAAHTTVVTVRNVNRAPVIPTYAPQVVTQEAELVLPLGITDPDGDALTISASIAGEAAVQPTVDASGTLHWTPSTAVVPGTYTIELVVADVAGAERGTVAVEVRRLNRAPVFDAPTQPLTAEVGKVLEFTIHATDPDGDEVTYSTNEGQVALSAIAGTVQWTPTEAGQVELTFTATDALGATATLPVVVNVSPKQPGDIDERPFFGTDATTSGCGCSSGSSSAALLLLPLLIWRRRRSMT